MILPGMFAHLETENAIALSSRGKGSKSMQNTGFSLPTYKYEARCIWCFIDLKCHDMVSQPQSQLSR